MPDHSEAQPVTARSIGDVICPPDLAQAIADNGEYLLGTGLVEVFQPEEQQLRSAGYIIVKLTSDPNRIIHP